jgi:hypothetical protein
MPISKVVFVGKSKKKTGDTRFMLNALKRHVKKAIFINVPRYKKIYFWTDYKKAIYKKIISCNPDLVIIYSKDLPLQVMETIKGCYKTAIFYPDMTVPVDEKLLQHAILSDYLFITNKGQLPELKSSGVKHPVFCMHGCDRDEHRITHTSRQKWSSDVAFIGKPSFDYRIELLKLIDNKFNLKAWGGMWKDYGLTCLKKNIYPKEFSKICFASKIIIGCDFRHDITCYFSNRTWIVLGCGGFLLTNYVPELETVFKKGVHLEWYKSKAECLDLISFYLKHEDKRKKIAGTGYEFSHANRTYDVVMNEMVSYIEKDLSHENSSHQY